MPKTYTVETTPAAERDLRELATDVQRRIVKNLKALANNPRPSVVRKLRGPDAEDTYRVRVGDDRIVYDVLDDVLLVLVVRTGHRSDVDRR